MGWCMSQEDSSFEIKRENFDDCLKAIKHLIEDNADCHWMWKDINKVLKTNNLVTALSNLWGWEFEYDEESEGITGIAFHGEKIGDEQLIFDAIAPFVEENSFIEMTGDDATHWRWIFKDGKCEERDAKISWD